MPYANGAVRWVTVDAAAATRGQPTHSHVHPHANTLWPVNRIKLLVFGAMALLGGIWILVGILGLLGLDEGGTIVDRLVQFGAGAAAAAVGWTGIQRIRRPNEISEHGSTRDHSAHQLIAHERRAAPIDPHVEEFAGEVDVEPALNPTQLSRWRRALGYTALIPAAALIMYAIVLLPVVLWSARSPTVDLSVAAVGRLFLYQVLAAAVGGAICLWSLWPETANDVEPTVPPASSRASRTSRVGSVAGIAALSVALGVPWGSGRSVIDHLAEPYLTAVVVAEPFDIERFFNERGIHPCSGENDVTTSDDPLAAEFEESLTRLREMMCATGEWVPPTFLDGLDDL